jgi:hypothetical protein
MKIKIFSSLLILLILGSCSSPEEPEEPATMYYMLHIEGTVTDKNNGAPIEGAFLELWLGPSKVKKTRTNSEGEYVLDYRAGINSVFGYILIASDKEFSDNPSRVMSKEVKLTGGTQIINFQI